MTIKNCIFILYNINHYFKSYIISSLEEVNKQENLDQDFKDFKLGRLFVYAGLANLFCGIYTTIFLFICKNFLKNFNKEKEYLRFSFIIFAVYFFYLYYFLFYGIFKDQRDKATSEFVDTLLSNIFYSLPISLYNLITFIIKYVKFKKD